MKAAFATAKKIERPFNKMLFFVRFAGVLARQEQFGQHPPESGRPPTAPR